ncbi:EAL domain-containing protein [Vibrio algarum]|uniref:cyclic-guanylate-specific phosphodiesterase n=1 Tax=Vibrio algarum TaxID=3020714 RepID=A0ABT4YY78_9VIBR|nr:EAL domain-containing protein [Vibrio sp. KJ40-1]MDB1126111.1 EAL domain-containing protein [Vibrio sp. KJ40-1]
MPDIRALKLIASRTITSKEDSASLKILQIYLVCIVVYLMFVVPLSNKIVEVKTQTLLQEIESQFDHYIEQFSYLLTPSSSGRSCKENLPDLRKSIFNSDRVKEIGIFDQNGQIYCTSNNGDTSFYLYQTIMNRLETSSTHATLSYTRTKFSRTKSIALIFRNETGQGLSILIPPRYLIRHINQALSDSSVNYRIEVISRNLSEQLFDEGMTQFKVKSDKYPLALDVSTTLNYYIIQFFHYCWVPLLLASLISIYYILSLHNKRNNNSLENSLRFAISNDYFELHYQPIVNLQSGNTVGCESLLRWKDPSQGYISPDIFIPLAEKVNLIEDITKLVLGKVSLFLVENASLLSSVYISVNISRSVILKPSFVTFIDELVNTQPTLASKIVLEITEDNNFSQNELGTLKIHLDKLSKHGFRFAVDDFGTGYSGLDFIRQFPFDFVKIDRVFVKSLYDDSTIIPLLNSMMSLATQLNMKTIVEGVEEASQLEILNRLGFVYIQGYYYSKPLPQEELIAFLT